jgi:hypothetical protein
VIGVDGGDDQTLGSWFPGVGFSRWAIKMSGIFEKDGFMGDSGLAARDTNKDKRE